MSGNELDLGVKLSLDMGNAPANVAAFRRQLNDTDKEIEKLKDSLSSVRAAAARAFSDPSIILPLSAALSEIGKNFTSLNNAGTSAFKSLGGAASEASAKFLQVQQDIGNIKSSLIDFTVRAGALGVSASRAITFESSFADVKKVVAGSRDELDALAQQIKEIGREKIPLPLSSLNEIAAAGGQLGLLAKDIGGFIELVGEASTSFDILPNEAGQTFGALRNIYSASMAELRLLGDQINVLGDRSNALERDILNLLTRSGGAAQRFGLLRGESAALAAAMLNLGRPPEIAATAMRNMLASLQGVEVQSKDFQEALLALGLDAADFAKSIQENPNKALDGFLARIAQLDARSQTNILQQLFGKGEDSAAIGDLVQSLEEYRRLQKLVGDGADYAGSMTRAFGERSRTAEAHLTLLKNSVEIAAINMTTVFLPVIRAVADGLRAVTMAMANFSERFPNADLVMHLTIVLSSLAGIFRLLSVAIQFIVPAIGPAIGALRGLISAASGGGAFAVLGASVRGFGGILSALFGGVLGRAIGAFALFTAATSGLGATFASVGAILVNALTSPLGMFLVAIGAAVVKIAGAGSIFGSLAATFGLVGRSLLALVGGPIGAAVTALVFLGVKFLDAREKSITFAGQQTTVGNIVSAVWKLITGTVATAVGYFVSGLSEITGVNAKSWAAVKQSASEALQIWNDRIRSALNAGIAAFVGFGRSVGVVAAGIVESFSRAIGTVRGLLSALKQDAQAALSGDFSGANVAAAMTKGLAGQRANFRQMVADAKKEVSDAGQVDYFGELSKSVSGAVKGVGQAIENDIAAQLSQGPRVGTVPLETRNPGSGAALPAAAIGGGGKSGAGGSGGSGSDDAKHQADAALQILSDRLAREEQLLQAQRDLELERAGDDAAKKLQIEKDYNDKALALQLAGLQAKLEAAKQEQALSKDRGEQARIGADIARIEGEIQSARQLSGIAAEKLAATEKRAADEAIKTARDKLAELQGLANTDPLVIRARLELENADLLSKLKAAGQTGLADDYLNALSADAQAGIIQQQIQQAQQAQQVKAQNIHVAQDAGTLTELEAQKQLRDLYAATAEQLDALAEKLQALGESSGLDTLKIKALEAKNAAFELRNAIPNPLQWIADTGQQSFVNSLTTDLGKLMDGAASVGGAFKSMAVSIAQALRDAAIREAAKALMALLAKIIQLALSAWGGGGASAGSAGGGGTWNIDAVKVFDGGPVGYAGGGSVESGIIKGPGSGTSDSIPAILPAGGFVIKARSVNRVGRKFLDALGAGVKEGAAARGIAANVSNGEYFFAPSAVAKIGRNVLEAINRAADIAPPSFQPAFAGGGFVGAASIASSGGRGDTISPTVNVSVSNQSQSGGGQIDAAKAAELGKHIQTAVTAEIIKQKRPGGVLY